MSWKLNHNQNCNKKDEKCTNRPYLKLFITLWNSVPLGIRLSRISSFLVLDLHFIFPSCQTYFTHSLCSLNTLSVAAIVILYCLLTCSLLGIGLTSNNIKPNMLEDCFTRSMGALVFFIKGLFILLMYCFNSVKIKFTHSKISKTPTNNILVIKNLFIIDYTK